MTSILKLDSLDEAQAIVSALRAQNTYACFAGSRRFGYHVLVRDGDETKAALIVSEGKDRMQGKETAGVLPLPTVQTLEVEKDNILCE